MRCLFPKATKAALWWGVLTATCWDTVKGQDLGLMWGFCLGFVLGFVKARLKLPRDGEEDPSSSAHRQGCLLGRDPGEPCTASAADGAAAPRCCWPLQQNLQLITKCWNLASYLHNQSKLQRSWSSTPSPFQCHFSFYSEQYKDFFLALPGGLASFPSCGLDTQGCGKNIAGTMGIQGLSECVHALNWDKSQIKYMNTGPPERYIKCLIVSHTRNGLERTESQFALLLTFAKSSGWSTKNWFDLETETHPKSMG